MAVNNSGGGGISFFTILFLIFLVLKLTDKIAWSWIWVTAPLWIGFILGIIFIIIYAIIKSKYPWL